MSKARRLAGLSCFFSVSILADSIKLNRQVSGIYLPVVLLGLWGFAQILGVDTTRSKLEKVEEFLDETC
ncbi:hypothetical protein [Edaphobacter acidisoli]|uniref:hypothetical protein n=1 Tax=Edaphobacter acidisoli TaxID=2040573 RepID=UPI00166C6DF7|nr:hypothetical protein [Edaphobacter acidisoli]